MKLMMKKFPWLILLLAPALAVAAQPRSIALTIQENGHVQVSETHDLDPPDKDGMIRVSPLPETLLPASVNATPLERGETFEIIAQRFDYDLRDDAALFAAHLGQTITCRQNDETSTGRLAAIPDFTQFTPTLLLNGDKSATHYMPNLRAVDSVDFPARASLARVPTLLWQVPPSPPPPPAVQLHYAAAGISWNATHEAILAADARSMALTTRVRLQNRTTRDYANARIRLALTEKGQYAPLVPSPADPRATRAPALRYSADGLLWVPERAAASATIIATYDLLRPLTLPAGADLYAGLAAIPSLAVSTRHVYDGVRFDRFQRNRRSDWNLGTEFSTAVETRLVFKNETASPLPPGEFRLLRGQADRALEWIGTDWLPPLAAGETATLNLGPAAGLSGRRIRTGYAEINPKVSEEFFEITLSNQTEQDCNILVIEHLYRGEKHEIAASSAEHSPGAEPHTIQFDIPVKAHAQKSFTYTVRYTW